MYNVKLNPSTFLILIGKQSGPEISTNHQIRQTPITGSKWITKINLNKIIQYSTTNTQQDTRVKLQHNQTIQPNGSPKFTQNCTKKGKNYLEGRQPLPGSKSNASNIPICNRMNPLVRFLSGSKTRLQ